MKKNWLIAILVVVLVGAGAWVLWRFSASEDGRQAGSGHRYRIGVILPLTGEASSYGESIQRGIDLAHQQAGRDDVELVYVDTKCEAATTVTAVNQLIAVSSVDAIIGEACSGATLAAVPIVTRAAVPLVSPASTSPELSRSGQFFFRTIPNDTFQGKFAAGVILADGHDRLAIVYGNEPYGIGLADSLSDAFENKGGKVLSTHSFEADAANQAAVAGKAAADSGAEAVYFVSNQPETMAEAVKSARQARPDLPIYASEAALGSNFIDAAGTEAAGLRVSSTYLGTDKFADLFRKAYGMGPTLFAAQAHDAYMAITNGLDVAAETGLSLQNAMENLDFSSATGRIRFDSNGDVAGTYQLMELRDGAYQEANSGSGG